MCPPLFSTPRRHGLLLVALTCAALLARPASAQYSGSLLPAGARVRVSGSAVGGEPFVGRLLRAAADSLLVTTGSGRVQLQLPTSRLTSLETSMGRDRVSWGLGGAVVGGVAMALIGAEVGSRTSPNGYGGLLGFLEGGLAGTVCGAVAGAIVAPERWRYVWLSGSLR